MTRLVSPTRDLACHGYSTMEGVRGRTSSVDAWFRIVPSDASLGRIDGHDDADDLGLSELRIPDIRVDPTVMPANGGIAREGHGAIVGRVLPFATWLDCMLDVGDAAWGERSAAWARRWLAE